MKRANRLFKKSPPKGKSGRKVLPFPKSTLPMEPLAEIGIRLTVSGKGTLPKKVQGYLRRNLKSLEGVVLTDSNAHYWINVVCLLDNLKGYSLSYIIAGTVPEVDAELTQFLDEPAMGMLFDFLEGLCCVFEHRIKIGPPEHLEAACEQIVRDFDEDFLQQFRNMWDDFSESSF